MRKGDEVVSVSNVLPGVPPLRFWGEGAVGWYCLAGAVTKYLEYVGDPVSYAEVMGVSGAAWRLIWNEGHWSPDNLIMAWYGDSVAETRIAEALGHSYAYVDCHAGTPRTPKNGRDAVIARIRAEIDAGWPVIANGIAGPEECLVAGYREGGDVLLVQSFFERTESYLEVRDWYESRRFLGLHLFTKTGKRRSRRENLIASLTWAGEMAAMTQAGGRAAGFAAYDAWARDMLRDEDFEEEEQGRLQEMSMGISDNGIILLSARKVAGDYLIMMQDEVGDEARAHLKAAAESHHQEAAAMGAAHDIMTWGNVRGEELVKRTRRENRERLAALIRRCKGYYSRAIDEIRQALEAEGVGTK